MSLAVIGVGAMGEALVAGWIASGIKPSDITVVDASEGRVAQLVEKHGVLGSDVSGAASAETVVLAVKPHQIPTVAAEIAGGLPQGALVVSIAAGVSVAVLEKSLPGVAVVRVMPNTPALVGEGMAGIVAGNHATESHIKRVQELMDAVGKSIVVEEKTLDALTALSGSGPAYLFYVAEAMIEGGVHQGLSRAEATALVNQTFVGASALLATSEHSATQLREMVTSPAGTTAAALRTLDDHGVRSGFMAAVEACRVRSEAMGQS